MFSRFCFNSEMLSIVIDLPSWSTVNGWVSCSYFCFINFTILFMATFSHSITSAVMLISLVHSIHIPNKSWIYLKFSRSESSNYHPTLLKSWMTPFEFPLWNTGPMIKFFTSQTRDWLSISKLKSWFPSASFTKWIVLFVNESPDKPIVVGNLIKVYSFVST